MLVNSLVTANIYADFPGGCVLEDSSQFLLLTLKSTNMITSDIAWFISIVSIFKKGVEGDTR